ncbi:stage V sporulation protein B [Vulcanibacillus modesticaldus]|uniref:Stage V sporulation protein B n=1 Tax=Vulcanibacillus modesticaldus TaxID=337097 RepID=A0A1D2YX74_9BACI|nr:stage V sporulation protein B [Vulcanibacillus modesticaldus]OEG00217.1 stage V sporulation protein B [Vulcanibacillus modesticaldus]
MKQNFIQGAMILVIGGLITRGLGTIYRIFLSRVIGAEAIGLYQMTFPTLIMLITIVTAGLPIAVSKIVAEAEAKNDPVMIKRTLRIALILVSAISIIISTIFYLLIPFIKNYLLTDERVYLTLLAIVPIIPIISISSVLRGYFQGRQNMIPSATSTIIETIFRMFSGMFLSYMLLPYGVKYASAGAMVGMVIGEIAGFFVLLIVYLINKKKDRKRNPLLANESLDIYKKITHIAIPVTTSQIIGSFAYFIEPSVVAHSLAFAGVSVSVATSQYGQLAGMALLIITFPTVITFSLSQSLIPAVSEAAAKEDMNTIFKRLHQALKIAYIIGIASSVYFFIMAEPIALVLFDTPEVSRLIKIIAPFATFLYLQRPLAATLQGLDLAKVSMKNSITGAIVKTIAIFILASRPELGIDGVAMAINLGMTLITILHFRSIIYLIGYTIEIRPILKITLSALIMGYISYYLTKESFLQFPLSIRLIIITLFSSIAYLYLLLLFRVIKKRDFQKIPWIGNVINRLWDL